MIYGLNHLLDPADFSYDVVSGVSAGAINAGGIAMFAPEDGLAMSEWIVQMWRNMTTGGIYRDWPIGIVEGFLFENGVYDNSPLLELV